MRQPVRRVAALALAACLAASCSGGSGRSATSSGTTAAPTTSTSPVTTRDDLKNQILADYKKANDAYQDAAIIGDPALATLEETYSGSGLVTARQGISRLVELGRVAKDGKHSRNTDRATVQQVLDGRAVIQDCQIDDGVLVDKESGSIVDNDTVTRLLKADMIHEQGHWKIERLTRLRQWNGPTQCA